MLGAIVTLALAVTAWTEAPHWRTTLTRAAQRLPTPRPIRERNEERVIVSQILDALATRPPADTLTLVLPTPPGLGDDITYLVYRLRAKLYPRPLDVVFQDSSTWTQLDLDYSRRTAPTRFPDLPGALTRTDVAVMVGGLAATPPGFTDATPTGAFGFVVRRRRQP